MTMKKSGFTLVEIMIVVLIIGLLAAIAVPNFVKARTSAQKTACIDNLRQIEGACEQVRMSGYTPTLDSADNTGIYGADKYIKVKPVCPTDKSEYSLGDDGRPVCGHADDLDHKLPDSEDASNGG